MIGREISHYRIVSQLGAGGMGVVYRAEDRKLGREVALKFLASEMCGDQVALERFRREARAASALNHPNICTIYDTDEADGRQFISLELLEGEPLSEQLRGSPLPLERLMAIAMQVAEALDAAHEKGVIHRDIKPSNIFVTRRGQAKILDFGLAKLKLEQARRARVAAISSLPTSDGSGTSSGTTLGTVAYMSPEQARGEELDARSDLYSFGAVLYEMATGRAAAAAATTALTFDAILNRQPAPPAHCNPGLPAELERIILKALEKDRRLRYQSAAEIGADLRRLKRELDSGGTNLRAPARKSGPIPARASSGAVELPVVSRRLTRSLFLLLQIMYLCIYAVALAQHDAVKDFLQALTGGRGGPAADAVLVLALVGIAVRLYLLSGVSFDFAGMGIQFRQLFPFLLVLDDLWALSPLPLSHRLGAGLALGCTVALLFVPFAQRTLVRMSYADA